MKLNENQMSLLVRLTHDADCKVVHNMGILTIVTLFIWGADSENDIHLLRLHK